MGEIPPEFANFTHLCEIDISKNQMTWTLPLLFGILKHLAFVQLYENYFTGEIPKGFGKLQNLVVFLIYENQFSGEFPENLGRFSILGTIDISKNQFSDGFLKFLYESNKLQFLLALDNNISGELSHTCANYNHFVGGITSEIEISASLNLLLLQNNEFSGDLPVEHDTKFGCPIYSDMSIYNRSQEWKKNMQSKVVLVCIVSFVMVFYLAGLIFMSYHSFMLDVSLKDNDPGHDPEKKTQAGNLILSIRQFVVEDIHNLDEENLIRSGGAGRVYRLPSKMSGSTFTVKQLFKGTDRKVLAAEMETLGMYEYMTNGNLFQALQWQIRTGQPELDRRYNIAVGAAKGLSYLHNDCSLAIIHRDKNSSSILLDENYEPKLLILGLQRSCKNLLYPQSQAALLVVMIALPRCVLPVVTFYVAIHVKPVLVCLILPPEPAYFL
ncbi:receptor protein-tyrosine kinase CEPR2-like [Aristolochia californica]|uniref:receptor protein-tyrosine kinase CEPR2-like n=1 Tax=Aristolochia californica TaxID=171875 RepID=UPI0035DCCBA6